MSWDNPKINEVYKWVKSKTNERIVIVKGFEEDFSGPEPAERVWVQIIDTPGAYYRGEYGKVSGFIYKGQCSPNEKFVYLGNEQNFPEFFL